MMYHRQCENTGTNLALSTDLSRTASRQTGPGFSLGAGRTADRCLLGACGDAFHSAISPASPYGLALRRRDGTAGGRQCTAAILLATCPTVAAVARRKSDGFSNPGLRSRQGLRHAPVGERTGRERRDRGHRLCRAAAQGRARLCVASACVGRATPPQRLGCCGSLDPGPGVACAVDCGC